MNQWPTPTSKKVGTLTSQISNGPKRVIELRDAIALIVGVVIGAGIFKAPSMVAGIAGSPEWMFGAWALGGLISLIGALCYAELATAYPHTGGDYHFLHRAFGRSVSFLYGWARFSVITTGSIALLAFVFGDYMNQVFPITLFGTDTGSALYAAASIVFLSWVNLRGVKTGTAAQTLLTVLEVCGLLLIAVAAVVIAGKNPAAVVSAPPPSSPAVASFGLAMVFVLLTYGGWNEAAYISAEIKGGYRNMVKALVLSILIITALYLLVVWAYWKGIGITGMAKSETVAADLLSAAFGSVGANVISLMIAIAALTSINATMIVGARTSYSLGKDWPVLAPLGAWDEERATPANALHIQCVAALLLVVVGTWAGSGFKAMVEFTAPVFWIFFFLSGLSILVLRAREPLTERPFKVPLYPLLPLIFCGVCAYMLWSSLSYVYSKSFGGWNAAWIGVSVLAFGLVLLFLMRRLPSRHGHAITQTEVR